MLWYLFFPIFFLFFTFYTQKYKWSGIVSILLLFFFSFFRGDEVGTDTMNYMDNIDKVVNVFLGKDSFFEDNSRYEYFYYLVCVFIYSNNFPARYIVDFFSIITFLFLFLGGKRFKINIPLLCFFYVITNMYVFSFNISRQFAAISIMFYGASYLKEEDWRKYLFFFWVIIGGLFHTSILLCLPLYICKVLSVDRKKISKHVFRFYIFASIVPLSALAFYLLTIINFGSYSENYGSDGDYASEGISVINLIYKLLLGILLYFIFTKREHKRKTDLYDNLFIVFLLVNAFFAYGNLATFRLKFNFEILSCLFLTIYCSKWKNMKDPVFLLYIIIKSALMVKVAFEQEPYYLQFN